VQAQRATAKVVGRFIEALEKRQLLSIVAPSHIVVVFEEDRAANAIGDTANMPYFNQLAGTGLVYSNSLDLNSTSQEGQMNYLAIYSGSTQGVTTNSFSGPFAGGNLAQSLNNKGLSFSGYAESMPRDGDTTDAYAASPTNSKYDDLYVRAYNPMAQFSNVGTGKTNAQVNKTFASFPTTAAGYAALPTVSFVVPNTLHNTHGSNDTSPYATDPGQYNYLRQTADSWLKSNLDGYVQWAKQNNSLLIITGDEGDRAHGFTSLATNKVTTIITGDSRLVVPGLDATTINPYTLLRTIEDMYGLTPLGNTATTASVNVNALGQLAAPGAQAGSNTALTASSNPSVFGQSVTFTATVTGSGSGTPSGTVTFKDGATTLGTASLNASGVASFVTSTLSTATHSITAGYGGSASFLASSSSTLADTVNKASTATSLTSSANPAVVGQSITFTATIAVTGSGAGTRTGVVTFKDGATTLGTGTLNSAGVATFATSSLSVAAHSITAVYGGDINFVASTSAALSEQVNSAPAVASTTAVVSSVSSPVFGQPITFTATVAGVPAGSATPTGTVQFVIDGANVGSAVSLSNGSAASAAIGNLAVGTHSVSAVYSGNATFSTSTSSSLSHTVGQASTSTALSSSANPSSFGQSLTFTATVGVLSPGAGTATGVVTFKDGSTTLGTGTLNAAGVATFTTSTLSVASHSITAGYGGATNFVASSSAALTQVVSAAATVGSTTSLASSANPSVFGQAVTFSATVAASSGTLTPTGTVTFKDGSTTLGTGTLNAARVATFTTSSLSVAGHSITAVYSGDANFSSSTSPALTQTISQSAGQSSAITSVGSSTGAKSIVIPSHVVIVVLSTHASNEIGDVTNMPYLNSLAAGGLVYSNSHGLNTPTQGSMMNYLALYSGSTQGTTSDSSSSSFSGLDLGSQLNAKFGVGNGFVGYAENLPSDGSQVALASGTAQGLTFTDAYNRAYNPVAMFDSATNSQVNKTFAEFPTNFANLPAVSFVLPNMLNSTHGSNEQAPWAGSTDPANNNQLKQWSDAWLKQNLDAYAQWARNNNSLLIITSSGGDKANGFTSLATNNVTTIINGAAGLVVPGTDTTSINPYNLLRTIEDMYGLAPLGSAGTASDVDRNAQGQLAPTSQTPAPALAGQAVTFTATVAAAGHGSGTPTGTVQFTIDGANFGSPVALVNGSASSLSTSALSVGNHIISAIYSGDGNFASAGVVNFTQTVSRATTMTVVSSSASSSTFGQGVTFTATVSAVAPGSGTPTGTVQFVIDGTNYGSPVALSGGSAVSPTISSLAAGNHTVWAVYSSDVNFVASTAATFTQTVV
jgi:hypothetical protein